MSQRRGPGKPSFAEPRVFRASRACSSAVTGVEVKAQCDRTGGSPSCRFTLAAS
jgi:hypothetical protein